MLDKTKCEGCGATGGVLIIDADGTFCSKCRQSKADPPAARLVPPESLYRRKSTLHAAYRVTEVEQVETRNGVVVAQPGDFVVFDTSGVPYPCAADVFAATYEPAAVPSSSSVLDDLEPFRIEEIPVGSPEVNGGVDGTIHRLRAAVTAFYGSDEAEPAPDVLEAREVELDQALRFWLLAGMPS
jgi:hypothetical protein